MTHSRTMFTMIPATAMLLCLGAHAIDVAGIGAAGGAAPSASAAAQQPPARALVPMRPMISDELKGKDDDEPNTRKQSLDSSLEAKEKRIVAQLGLSDEQKQRYLALQDDLHRQTAEMMTLPSGHVERGMEINAFLHKSLRQIFTPEQYAKYMQLWSARATASPSAGKNANAPKLEDPMASGTPFGGTDEDILSRIRPGLTAKQWEAYAALRVEMDEMNQEMYRLLREGDTMKAGFMSGDINRANLEGMKKVLKPAQYQQWIDMWDEVMSPYIGNVVDPNARREIVAVPLRPNDGDVQPVAAPVDDGDAQPQ